MSFPKETTMEKAQDWEMGGPDKDARFNDVFEAATISLCVEHIFPF